MATPNPRQMYISFSRQASSKPIPTPTMFSQYLHFSTSTNKYTPHHTSAIMSTTRVLFPYLYLPMVTTTTTAAVKYPFSSTLSQADQNLSTLSIPGGT